MAHPVILSPKSFFYPIGNTPATSLVEYIPPDTDASLLVLGCGDPRNALYTIHSDSKLPFDRALDFTFCDAEPAVLARNILIYTLIHDRCDEDTIQALWKIYLDVFIDSKTLDVLTSHCKKLIEAARSLDTWKAHTCGSFMNMCTADTLQSLRSYWQLYISSENNSIDAKSKVLEDLRAVYEEKYSNGYSTTSLRSAGVMAVGMVMLGGDHFRHYWKHGVTDVDPTEVEKATHVNPTLLHSSSGSSLNIHYGTHPILVFHLAPALAETEDSRTLKSPPKTIERVIEVAKKQFGDWCRSFSRRVLKNEPKLKLRFFLGDAMSFCKALRFVFQNGSRDTPEYTNAWGLSTISFVDDYGPNASNEPPLSFNVIETSNLTNHLGFLNVLLVCSPLLKRGASSVFFTHSLVPSKAAPHSHTSALQQIGLDLPFLCLVFGIVPERASSDFTSQSAVNEALMSSMGKGGGQLFEFNVWRVPAPEEPGLSHTFICDTTSLGNTLFAALLELFNDEGIAGMLQSPLHIPTKHYTRETFVNLLQVVRQSFTGDWEAVMERLFELMENDRTLMVGLQNYQDFCRALHLAGLRDIMPDPNMITPLARNAAFQGWDRVPRSVFVALVVPRSKIQALIDNMEGIVTPCVQCELSCPGGQNFFPSIRTTFGTLEVLDAPKVSDRRALIHEDPAGWRGNSDLIAFFPVPAWMFMNWPLSQFTVGLMLYGRLAMRLFIPVLGLNLSIFSTSFADSNRAFVLKDRPCLATQTIFQDQGIASNPPPVTTPSASTGGDDRPSVVVKFSGSKVETMSMRCTLADSEAKLALANKSTSVRVQAISISAIEIAFESFKEVLRFPYPIDHSRLTTRIARKSSYIEVEGRILDQDSLKIPVDLNSFPVILKSKDPVDLWATGMHYLALDALPAFRAPLPPQDKSEWLQTHFGFALREEKSQFKAASIPGGQQGLTDVKDSLTEILQLVLINNKGKPAVVHLKDPKNGGTFTLLFVNCIRIDLTAHTVVIDACALPLTVPLLSTPSVDRAIRKMLTDVGAGRFMSFELGMGAPEVKWWKVYLPTAVERCRTWKHQTSCEYLSQGVPRSLEMEQDPICGCGRGKNLGGFNKMKEWAGFAPHVTRIALGMPYSTSLLGESASAIRASVKEKMGEGTGSSPGASSKGGEEMCAGCGGPGKPKLLACSRCKGTKYCSTVCQKTDWKRHKLVCPK